MEGPGGRTPRAPSPWRLYRVLSRGTHTSSAPPGRAQEGSLSRRRRTYIRVYPLHYSPRFLKRPRVVTEPTLFGGMTRPLSHIGIGPESLWTCQGGSLEG